MAFPEQLSLDREMSLLRTEQMHLVWENTFIHIPIIDYYIEFPLILPQFIPTVYNLEISYAYGRMIHSVESKQFKNCHSTR